MSLPLADVRVVDFCQVYAGPASTMFLADQGAQVIKIEPPEGDSARAISPIPGTNYLSQGYVALNRNKRGVIVDITKPQGLEVAYRLVRWADVMVINMRGSVPQRLNLGYEDLVSINPRLIYVSMTAYGERGPDATLPGYDVVIQSKSGTEAQRRLPDGTPVPTRVFYNDMSGAMLAAFAVTVALRDRERTGRGQKLELNLLHTALALQAAHLVKVPLASHHGPGDGLAHDEVATTYRCSDGRAIVVPPFADGQWRAFCDSVGLDHLAEDPIYATFEDRMRSAGALRNELSRHFGTRPAIEWDAMFKVAQLPGGAVKEISEVYDDPQVVANQMFVQFQQPTVGPVTAVNAPIRLSDSLHESRMRRHAPGMGEHTLEVLRELGYSAKEVESLQAEGILG